ncbi:hypothetical protein RRG08_006066 [Elysia crispata]|uniref:SH2 domain-containing protein n=1 Tax=Elysia crispata TaxID=231223 RepID=A0AAE0Z3V2_9GAST|nr:hypothetical protein RRG08_006066 [Elysia crispata]
MPSQRRPPPPPPPAGDSAPPPLPNRVGAVSSQPPAEQAPPPLPNRDNSNGSSLNAPALPARPPQSPKFAQDLLCEETYLLPDQENQQKFVQENLVVEDEYSLPDQEDEVYEEVSNPTLHFKSTNRTKLGKPEDELYEEMSAPVPNHPPPVPFKPQVPLPQVPELSRKPILPQVPQATALPPLPLPIEKENHGKSKQSLKPWSSFRELMSRPKVSQGDDRKRKISAPAKRNNVEEEILNKEEPESPGVYEMPESPLQPQGSTNHSGFQDGGSSDSEGGWSDSEFDNKDDDVADGGETNGGATTPDPDLYLTPEGGSNVGEQFDETYEAPVSGFDRVQEHSVPPAVRKPPVAQRNQQQPNAKSVSVSDRVKIWGQLKPPPSSNEKTTPIAKRNLSTPPKPKNFLPDSSTRPNLPKKPQVLNNVGKQTIAPKTDKTPPNPSNKPPTLPPKPTEDAPPALPPNHPKRDGNSDEGGSAGSTSSGSGGVMVNRAFKSELKEVIGSQLCLRNAQKNQVITNVANGDDEIYDDGSSVEPMHPLSIYPWFHEDATKENSDMRVKRIGQEGAFLIRKSSQKDSYTLVVYSGNDTYNMLIALRKDGKYAIGKEKTDEKRFESVADFINHHLQYKITLSKGGSVVLSKPVPRP